MGRRKPKTRGARDKRDYKKDDDKMDVRSTNDPRWYASDPAILRDAASMPFNYPYGRTLDMGLIFDASTGEYSDSNVYQNIPGVMSLRMVPSFGRCKSPSDPLNVASQSIYSYIRHANSGHSNYEAPDLMMYLLAMSSMYQYIVWAQRLYGLAMVYDQRNRYLPHVLLKANGVNADSLRTNLANYRLKLNEQINKVASFAVPATFTLFNRQAFMYKDIYIENNRTVKDSIYLYVPYGFYKFAIDETTSLGKLVFEPITSGPDVELSYSDVLAIGDRIFSSIWGDEDFGIMSGDILKAYGDNIIKLESVPELFFKLPIYDEMVLTQMKNTYIMKANEKKQPELTQTGLSTTDTSTYLTCDNDFTMTASFSKVAIALNQMLCIDSTEVTPEMVIEATRGMVAFSRSDLGTDPNLVRVYTGSEYCFDAQAWTLKSDGTIQRQGINQSVTITANAPISVPFQLACILSQFRYHPQYIMAGEDAAASVMSEYGYLNEITNFRIMSNWDIQKLHEAAWLNMLNVPSIGKVNVDR